MLNEQYVQGYLEMPETAKEIGFAEATVLLTTPRKRIKAMRWGYGGPTSPVCGT